MSWGVNAGYNWGGQEGENQVGYVGNSVDALRGYLGQLINSGVAKSSNAGALYDMILGGKGFGQSRRYNQYDPYNKTYGYLDERKPKGNTGEGPAGGGPKPQNPNTGTGGVGTGDGTGGPTGDQGRPTGTLKTAPGSADGKTGEGNAPGALGSGQQDPNDWYDPEDPSGINQYGAEELGGPGNGWNVNDDAPVEGQGYLGEVLSYGRNPNEIDRALTGAYGWQSSGELSDLEQQDKWNWQNYGQRNAGEAANDEAISWQRGGDLSDLEQQEKWGFKNYADATDLENEVGRNVPP